MIRLSVVLLAMLFAFPAFEEKLQVKVSYAGAGNEDAFIMPVEDVFYISGRGTVATGIIEKGTIQVGETVEILGIRDTVLRAKVTGIEAFRKLLTEGTKGQNVGLLFSGIDKSDVERGMVICSPGAIKAHTEFKCQLTLKTKEDGGRGTPIFAKYRPLISIKTQSVSGELVSFDGKEELNPGETSVATIKLLHPAAMDKNNEFVIKESGRVIGTGKITEIIK